MDNQELKMDEGAAPALPEAHGLVAADASAPRAFDSWAETQMRLGELSEASVDKYRPLWNAWVGWTLQQDLRWDRVSQEDIGRFLQGPAPGQHRRRRTLKADKMSGYTRQRYWRLLCGVYAEASRRGWVESNLALDLPDADRPKVMDRDRQSQILEPAVFERLRSPVGILRAIHTQSEQDWWHVRDRAIMAVLAETGITASELIALRGVDVRDPQTLRPMDGSQPSLLPPDRIGCWIDVMATTTSIERSVPMRHNLTRLLQEWIRLRGRLLEEKAARLTRLSERSSFLQKHASEGPLFVTRRARAGAGLFPAMDQTAVYHTVKSCLKNIRDELQEGLGAEEVYVAKGPAVVRNTVLRHWLDTVGVEEAVKLAGLKNAESLRLRPNKEAGSHEQAG